MKLNLVAEARKIGKKSDTRQLRRDGLIPAVIYGEGKDALHVTLNDQEFSRIYKKGIGEVAFFDVSVDGEVHTTIVKDKQIHPVTRKVLHIDFQRLCEGKEISMDVPFRFEGTPIGTKTGGVLDISLRSVHVSSLPKNIKDDIVIELSDLKVGDVIHIGDLDLGEMTTRLSKDLPIASVHLPRGVKSDEEEEEVVEEAEATE